MQIQTQAWFYIQTVMPDKKGKAVMQSRQPSSYKGPCLTIHVALHMGEDEHTSVVRGPSYSAVGLRLRTGTLWKLAVKHTPLSMPWGANLAATLCSLVDWL